MTFEFPTVAQHGLERTAEVLTRGFSDYLVKIAASPAMLLQMVRADSVDVSLSRLVVGDGAPVGAALIARRGWTSRLAAMALVPEARGQGAGRALLERLLHDARERGDRAMTLEVIEQNPPAVALYERSGFERVRRLVGFSRGRSAAPAGVTTGSRGDRGEDPRAESSPRDGRESPPVVGELSEVDVRVVGAKVTQFAGEDLPWQLSGETLGTLGPPHLGLTNGRAWIALGAPNAAVVPIRALVSADGDPTGPAAAALLAATLERFSSVAEWRVVPTWPEAWADVFVAAGFTRAPLSQWQMKRPLG